MMSGNLLPPSPPQMILCIFDGQNFRWPHGLLANWAIKRLWRRPIGGRKLKWLAAQFDGCNLNLEWKQTTKMEYAIWSHYWTKIYREVRIELRLSKKFRIKI
jgi:hypothetical protein